MDYGVKLDSRWSNTEERGLFGWLDAGGLGLVF